MGCESIRSCLKSFVPAPVWPPLLWNGMFDGCFVSVGLLDSLSSHNIEGLKHHSELILHRQTWGSTVHWSLETHILTQPWAIFLLCPQFISILSQPIPSPGGTPSPHSQLPLPISKMSVLSHGLFSFFELDVLCLFLSRVRGEWHTVCNFPRDAWYI